MTDVQSGGEEIYSPLLEKKPRSDSLTRLRRSRPPPPTWFSLLVYALVGVYIAVLFSGVLLVQLPSNVVPPVSLDNPEIDLEFNEAPAKQFMDDLVQLAYVNSGVVLPDNNIGITGRLSTTESIVVSATYIEDKLKELQARYPTVTLDIDRSLASGVRSFANQAYVVAYDDVENVVARLGGKNGPNDRAILLSAHYDSSQFSPGASSNAAAVAAAFEILRVLMAQAAAGNTLNATVIVLFDDAKEACLLGIDAFAKHQWFPNVATYINMDSLGGWGRPLLTQLGPENDWLAKVYKDTVQHPEASVIATELFEFTPTSTNFNIFAQLGVPGVEFDLYRDGYIYNTLLDTTDSYQSGTLTLFGNTVISYINGLVNSAEFYQLERLQPGQNRTTATYYDVLLGSTVAYSPKTANTLAAVSTVFTVLIFAGGIWVYNRQSRLPVWDRVVGISLQMLFSIIFIGADCFVSILMAAVFGVIIDQVNPLVWYANVPVGVFGVSAWAVVCSNFFLLAHASGLHWFRWPLWNRGYGGAVVPNEVLVACSVQVITTGLMLYLTAHGLGVAYLPFWYAMFFNIAGLGAVIYFAVTVKNTPSMRFDLVEHDEHPPVHHATEVSRFPYPDQSVAKLTKPDQVAWTLFYLTWTIFPTLLALNLAYSSTYSIIPVLGRLGVPEGETYLGLLVGLIYGTFAVSVCAPWFALQQRYQHRSVLSGILAAGALIALLVGMFAVAPFTDSRPRQVEVAHYYSVNLIDGTTYSAITLSSPSPPKLFKVSDAMTTFTEWVDCDVPAYRFIMQKGLCLREQVPTPNVTVPTVNVEGSSVENGVWTVQLTITAPDAAALLFRFTGDLTGWSLPVSVPPKGPQGNYIADYNFPGYIEVLDGHAILYRSRSPVQSLTLVFASSTRQISWEAWSNVRAVSPLQQQVIEDLPSWASLWGKSNVPGPIVAVARGTLAAPQTA